MIYSAIIFILDICLRIYGIFSPKIAQWNLDRKNQKGERSNKEKLNQTKIYRKVVWMHCASLGEFEQGRLIIDRIKLEDPTIYFLLSFFSPSGYEIKKNYKSADEVVYLPLDSTAEMSCFIDYYNPAVFIGVKYEWWWNLFDELNKRSIPKVLIALKPKINSYIFKPFFAKYRNLLISNSYLYCQDEATFEVFSRLSQQAFLSGDPRVESVLQRKSHLGQEIIFLEKTISGRKVIVYGSVYEQDMKVLSKSIDELKDYYHIIVPHDVSMENCQKMSFYFSEKLHYLSTFDELSISNKILIDQVGLLFDLYKLGDAAYIGGGFGKSIHNTLEPAVFGLPTAIGPNNKGFAEIDYWLEYNTLFVISTKEDFDRFIKWSNQVKKRIEIIASQQSYFGMNEGVCDEIVKKVYALVKLHRM